MLYAYLISHVAHCLASIVPPPAEGKVVPQTPKGGRVQKVLKIDRYKDRRVLRFDRPNGQSIKRKALLWAGYGPTSTDLHILCRMCTA